MITPSMWLWVRLYVGGSHIDNGVFELNMQSVVRDGDDGVIGTAQKLHPFALKSWERHLQNTHTNTD